MRERDDVARARRVNGSSLRALLAQGQMSSRGVVVGHVSVKHATQMSFIENDVVVKAVSPNRSDEPLHVWIGPGRAWRDEHLVHTETLDATPKYLIVCLIAVTHHVLWRRVPRESLDHLLRGPLGSRVLGNIEVNNLAALVPQHEEDVEDPKRCGGHGEEIDRSKLRDMVIEERSPCLGRRLAVTDHVLGDRRLGDDDAKHLEFAVYARRAPERILA